MDIDNSDSSTNKPMPQGHGRNHPVIHVRQDSASELEALFNTVMNPNYKSKSLPMKARNLPKSFFLQPDRPRQATHYHHSHSQSMGVLSGGPPVQLHHSRSSSSDSNASHSSPAGMTANSNNNNASVASPGMPTSPMNGNINHKVGYGLSPAQRRAVAHNQFANSRHNSLQTPQVSHSRSKSSPASLQLLDLTTLQVKSSDIPPDMPLPPGWSVAKTADGQQYFMNHNDRTTTWEDPRLAIIKQQRQNQLLQSQSLLQQNVASQQPPMHDNNNISSNMPLDQQPLPLGWAQATTDRGEVYYINHHTKSTSWIDPRLHSTQQGNNTNQSNNVHLQQQLIKLNQMEMPGGQGRGGMPQKSMIKHLVQDKDLMMRRDMMKQQMSSSVIDPFMGSSNSNFQRRDASLDGGATGSGIYNMQRTSDEYLAGVEEMDTGDVSRRLHGVPTPQMVPSSNPQTHVHTNDSHFPDFLDSLPASNVDFASPNTSNPIHPHQPGMQACPDHPGATMDGGDLVPTLQDTLTQDFDVESVLNHVKAENVDNSMIWL